ncbi:hypothetical protein IKJ53_04625, partial [bacterium]|nr:hypothetical protein [bacterium]
MANLTEKDIKNGVLKGTNKFDEITIDNNYTGKKVTVKADKGDDRVYVSDYAGDLTVYAGMGADVIATGTGKNTLYGESGTNTFEINPDATSVTISAGVGKAIIDVSSFASINDSFFSGNMNAYFERNGNDLVMYPKGKNETNIITIKGFYKQRGEILLQYEVNNGGGFESKQYDLRDLNLTTYLSQQKSANFTGGSLNETIEGDNRRNTIKGGDGNDVIYGWGGNDKLYGENGSNSLFGGAGDDIIYGGAINDLIDGGVGNNKLYGKQGDNTYIHGGGNDTIYLEKNSNTNLWLDGYLITDRNKKGNDLELLTFKDGESGSIVLKNFFKLEGIADTITVYETDSNSSMLSLLPHPFQVTGKGTIKGTAFDDYILGSTKADKIYAIDGEDEIYADKGNDKIYSGEAKPTLRFNVGDGKDTLYGNFDSLHFHSVQSSDLEYTKIKDDLVIKYSDKDSVTLSGYFANNSFVKNIKTSDDFVELRTILESYNNKLEYNYGDGTVKFYSMPDEDGSINYIKFNGTLDLDNTFQDQKGNDLVISQFGAKNDKLIIVDYFKNGYDIQIEDNTSSLGTLNGILDYYFKEA